MNDSILTKYKEVLRLGMIENFEKDGYLIPLVFFLKNDTPIFSQIPNELLSTNEGKTELASIIRLKCQEPNVFAAGLIIEARIASVGEDDDDAKKLLNGELSISDMKNKQDVIMLVFSTPQEQESIIYTVDCENKKVGELLNGGEALKDMGGRFSDFFKWNKN